MDQLQETIHCLTDNEVKEFRLDLQKTARSKEIVQLFDAYHSPQEYKNGELGKKIYGSSGESKFHAARRRLFEQLNHFLLDRYNEGEDEIESQINQAIAFAGIMIRRRNFAVAAERLNSAHEMAEHISSYELLDIIYRYQLSHPSELVDDVPALCARAEQNRKHHNLLSELNIAFARIKNTMKILRAEGRNFDPETTIREELRKLQYNKRKLLCNPVFMRRLLELVRTVVASGKDYSKFKPYVHKAYNLLLKANAFTGYNASLECEFLYMISHVHYRTREFDVAKTYLEKLKAKIGGPEERHHHLYARAMTLNAGILFYSNQLNPSIELLQHQIDLKGSRATRIEKLNMRLNLAVYLFFARDFKTANRILLQLPLKTNALESEYGKEWFFKRDLIDVIFQYELGHLDISASRLKAIQTNYAEVLQEPIYQRAEVFIQLITHFFNHPEEVRTEAFLKRVVSAGIKWEGQSEDIQAILFFCWLRGKMQGRESYEVVLERVMEEV